MWSRKELKKTAKNRIRKNYIAMVAVCFIIAFLTGSYNTSTGAIHGYNRFNETKEYVTNPTSYSGSSTEKIVEQLYHDYFGGLKLPEASKPYNGTIGWFINLFTQRSGPFFQLYNAIRTFITRQYVFMGISLTIGVLLNILYRIFIRNTLLVGEKRFFLESRLYGNTRISRVGFMRKRRGFINSVKIMFLLNLYQFLWNLTIIGGFIKAYEYRMIPYILAENPSINRKEAFLLSRQMMRGNKWKAFVLDLSYIGWWLLTILSLGIVGFFWMNPYMSAVNAELYAVLRGKIIEEKAPYYESLNDAALFYRESFSDGALAEDGEKRYDLYPGLEQPKKHFTPKNNYDRHYSLSTIILLFFTFSLIGWLWEVCLYLFQDGILVNRGVLCGPWLPIYGTGGCLALLLLKRFYKNPILTYFSFMMIAGFIEYITSWFLEAAKGVKYWDYSGYFLNLNGRICVEGLITFAFGGCAVIYFLAPRLDHLYSKLPKAVRWSLCLVLILLFVLDLIYTHSHPNTGYGITQFHNTSA